MSKKIVKKEEAEVHKELKGFDMHIDNFGELKTTYSIDKINAFLNQTLPHSKETGKNEEE